MRFVALFALSVALLTAPAEAHWFRRTTVTVVKHADGSTTTIRVTPRLIFPRLAPPIVQVTTK